MAELTGSFLWAPFFAAQSHGPVFEMSAAWQSLAVYWKTILLTLPYTLVLSLAGMHLVVRRESLYGILTGQSTYVFFMLALSIFHWFGWDLFTVINERMSGSGSAFLWLIDLSVLPVVLLFLGLFTWALRRGSRNTEASMAVLLVLFFSLENLFTGHEKGLVNLYFTEIIYTSHETFTAFLPVLLLIGLLFLLNHRPFLVLSTDREQAALSQHPRHELLYNLLMPLLIVTGVRVMGPYISVTALIVPALTAAWVSRSMKSFYIWCVLLSVFSTLFSFMCAFSFGTSASAPVMVLAWLAVAVISAGFAWLYHHLASR